MIGGRDEKVLFPGPGLPGGGQTQIRMVQSIYTSDPDELEVAQRLRPDDMESWLAEWSRVAEKNERLADGYAMAGLKVTAHEHYRRAQEFGPMRLCISRSIIRNSFLRTGRCVRCSTRPGS